MAIPLNYLECFVVLARTLNFSEAARQLHLSQPSVSRQIRLFEELLDTPLFVRDRHRVHLSAAGRALHERVAPLFEAMQQAFDDTRHASTALRGCIRFGCLFEVGRTTLFPHVMAFCAQHPELELAVEYLREVEIVDKVKRGELDFGVVTSPQLPGDVLAYPILKERVVLVTRAGNRRPFRFDRADGPPRLVAYRQDDPLLLKFLRHNFRRSRRVLDYRVRVNSHQSMIDALVSTDSYAVMPEHVVRALIDDGALRIVPSKPLDNTLYLILRESHLIERRNAALRKYLLEAARAA